MSLAKRLINFEFNSALARRLLAMYYKPGQFYRVPFGPIASDRLLFAPEINFHMMLGLWETRHYRKTLTVLQQLDKHRPLRVVADVGANVGYCTLMFSKYFPDAVIYAFECSPDSTERLRRNLEQNKRSNVRLVEKAVTDRDGEVRFFIGHHHKSSIHEKWAHQCVDETVKKQQISVPSTSLDSCFRDKPAEELPQFIKVDIEGGGTLALPGMREVVQRAKPIILIESHTPEEDRAISDLVLACDYLAFRIDDEKIVSSPEKIHPHNTGIWGTLLLGPRDLLPRLV